MEWTHWIMREKRSIYCPGHGCPICDIRKKQKENKEPYTYGVARRLRMYVYNYETNRIELLEQGVTFFEELLDLKKEAEKEGKELKDIIFKIKRKGATKENTSYRIDLDEYSPINLEDDMYNVKDLMPLNDMFKPHEPEKILQILDGKSWAEVFISENDEEKKDELTVE